MITETFPNDFKLMQADGYHFTSDAIHLAKFIKYKPTDRLLELCAGSGVIGIFSYANKPCRQLDFVELQPKMCDVIRANIAMNDILGASVLCADIAHLTMSLEYKYNVLIANPPYEAVTDGSPVQRTEEIAIARHEIKLKFDQLVKFASSVIVDRGRFFIVHKAERTAELIVTLSKYGFSVKRLKFIMPKSKQPHIVLIDAMYKGADGVRIEMEECV